MPFLEVGVSGEFVLKKTSTSSSKLYLVPLVLAILYPFTCLLTYTWAVLAGHINPIFSYISDGGTTPPEMCVFGQLLHFICILYFGVVYIRYCQVKLYYKWKYQQLHSKANTVAFINGLLSILGTSLVANFQETNVLTIHVLGAWLVFMCGNVWGCLQAYLSFKLLPEFSSKPMAYFRSVLGVGGVVLCVILQIHGTVSFFQFKGSLSGTDMLKHQRVDKGWVRGTAVVVEWIMSSFFVVFITTFIPEFKKLGYKSPEIILTVEVPSSGDSVLTGDISKEEENTQDISVIPISSSTIGTGTSSEITES